MINVEHAGPVCRLTINRPDKAGALTEQMLRDLLDGVRTARDAPGLILTGTGAVFSAGADLDAARAGLATSPLWEELSAEIATFPGLTIAALNGTVAGGATGMVLACDVRLAVDGTKFFSPVMKLG
ncbi:MAG: enoyl-CoA hydratase/isomerase family protein, partial [Tateyamaria sp.]